MKREYKTFTDFYSEKIQNLPYEGYDGYIDEYNYDAEFKNESEEPRVISLLEKINDVNYYLKDSLKEPIKKLCQEVIELGDLKKWWINSNNKRVSYSLNINNFDVSFKIYIHYTELKEYPKLMTSKSSEEIAKLLSDVINNYIPDSKSVSFELI